METALSKTVCMLTSPQFKTQWYHWPALGLWKSHFISVSLIFLKCQSRALGEMCSKESSKSFEKSSSIIILAGSVLNYSNSLKISNLGTGCVHVYFIKQDRTLPLCLHTCLIFSTRIEVLQARNQDPLPAVKTLHLLSWTRFNTIPLIKMKAQLLWNSNRKIDSRRKMGNSYIINKGNSFSSYDVGTLKLKEIWDGIHLHQGFWVTGKYFKTGYFCVEQICIYNCVFSIIFFLQFIVILLITKSSYRVCLWQSTKFVLHLSCLPPSWNNKFPHLKSLQDLIQRPSS